jgi:hypothetical protein
VSTDEDSTGFSFEISDSEVDAGHRAATGIGAVDFTATRVPDVPPDGGCSADLTGYGDFESAS